MATAATAVRLELAERLAAARPAGVAAMVVGGSVGRGKADAYSDLDLLVAWHRPPTEAERTAWIDAVGGSPHRLLWIDEERLWFDDWALLRGADGAGIAVEGVHLTLDLVEAGVDDLVGRCDTDLAKHVVFGQLVHGSPLLGDERVRGWRERLEAYPDELARAMVARHAQIDHFWRLPMLHERRNPVLHAAAVADVHQRVLHALLAVNRVYFFGFKSLEAVARRLPLAPRDLTARIRVAYELPAPAVAAALAELVEESYDLVEAHVPGADVERLRRIFRYRRPLEDG